MMTDEKIAAIWNRTRPDAAEDVEALINEIREQRKRITILETAARAAMRLWLWAKNAGWGGDAQQDVLNTEAALVAVGDLDPKKSQF